MLRYLQKCFGSIHFKDNNTVVYFLTQKQSNLLYSLMAPEPSLPPSKYPYTSISNILLKQILWTTSGSIFSPLLTNVTLEFTVLCTKYRSIYTHLHFQQFLTLSSKIIRYSLKTSNLYLCILHYTQY